MAIYRDTIEGDIKIHEASSIQGQVHGCVTVMMRRNLQVHGVIVGTLTIQEGAEVFIHGSITGNIFNDGSLYIFGTVNGDIETSVSGDTIVGNRATVVGKCRSAGGG